MFSESCHLLNNLHTIPKNTENLTSYYLSVLINPHKARLGPGLGVDFVGIHSI